MRGFEMRGGWGGHGRGRWGGGPFWFGGPWGGPPPWAQGRSKARRGDVRAAILALLRAEEALNGYQIIQEIEARSGGEWRPSPGAVYPALQQLADEGLIEAEESDGRKTFRLTAEGRDYVEAHEEEMNAPWEAMTSDVRDDIRDLFRSAARTGAALMQIVQAGSESQVAEAKAILTETRRRLYQLLAEDD